MISQMNLLVKQVFNYFRFFSFTLNVADIPFMVDNFFQWRVKLVSICLGTKLAKILAILKSTLAS